MGNLREYKNVTTELEQIYTSKNHDYGDSFSILYKKYGLQSVIIRLCDKILRLEKLRDGEQKVKGENIDDTLKDIANYAIMALAERKKHQIMYTQTKKGVQVIE